MKSLRVVNMICTGRLPFKKKMRETEVRRLIQKGRMGWMLINDETSPILQARIEKEGTTVHHTRKCICISVWASGAINIVGVIDIAEAKKAYRLTLADLKTTIGRVFE